MTDVSYFMFLFSEHELLPILKQSNAYEASVCLEISLPLSELRSHFFFHFHLGISTMGCHSLFSLNAAIRQWKYLNS